MNYLRTILIPLFIGIVLSTNVIAQAPEKMSYQAVIRNTTDALITNQTVGMQISILQGSISGTAMYIETQTPSTNINGLVSIEIGSGTVVSGSFSSIDWANGLYFIKTETDPTGGTNYTISGTSQLLSVPYALHAKTAESITGGITETDPVFGASVANGITVGDTTNWNNHFSGDYNDLNNAPTNVSTFNNDAGYLTGFTETDPDFNASVAAGITSIDTANWNDHFSGDYNDLNNAPTNVSTFTNDAGYLTTYTEIDPKIGSNTLGFSPKWDGSTLVTGAVYQDPTNKIGIGTTTPTNAISVIGNGDFSTSVKSPLYTPLAGDGNSLTIQANNSSTGAGGNVNIYSGIGNPGNLGGQINIVAAPINAGVGQAVSIIGSDNAGGGGNNAGPIVIRGGNATVANGGIVSITGGSSGGGNSAAAGVVNITGGAHVGSSPQLCGGADVNISGGPQTVASGAGVGGSVVLKGGVSSGSGAHGSILMQTGATSSTRLLIDPNGNVGIGNNNPSARLHIGNGTLATASSDASIFLQSGDGAGSARDWKIYVPMSNGYLGFRDMGFDNSNNGMSADAMAIQYGTGNVGIGTTNPSAKLDLGSGYGASGEKFLIYNDDVSGPLAGTKTGFYLDRFSLQNNATFVFPSAAAFPGSYIIAKKDTGNTLLVPIFTILGESENIGIGTISPSKKLDVNGDINFVGTLYKSGVPVVMDGSETKINAGENIAISGNGTIATPYVVSVTKPNFYLGQDTLEGIVFYIYLGPDGMQHGLIVSKTETTAQWQSISSSTNADRTWDGEYNTDLITNSIAKDWIVANFSSEWYLPSIDELTLLWNNRFHVNKAIYIGGYTQLNISNYWSSTEYNSANAFFIYSMNGNKEIFSKTGSYGIRAIRSF